jgi:hypothetical protein
MPSGEQETEGSQLVGPEPSKEDGEGDAQTKDMYMVTARS